MESRYLLLVAIVLAIVSSSESAMAQPSSRRGNAAQYIWVLDNSDADFKQPPFEDSLTVFDSSGRVIRKTNAANICQTVGGHRAIAVSSDGLFAVVVENVRNTLTCYRFPGEKAWSVPVKASAVDISRNGKVYVLTSKGTIYGDQLIVFSLEDGSKLAQVDAGGFDLAIDDRHQKIWVVGADIQKLNKSNLEVDVQLAPIRWCAVSVDFTADGSAWVAEREHTDVQGSSDRILKISPAGKIVKSIDLKQTPVCLAVDRVNDLVWVASGTQLLVYDGSTGQRLREIASGPCWTVRVRQSDQTAWAALRTGQILQFDREGQELNDIGGFSVDQKYIAVPAGRSLLNMHDR